MLPTIPVGLTKGGHDHGILQVSIDGSFRTVCNDGFDDVDAAVACRDLGFENGRKLPTGEGDALSGFPLRVDTLAEINLVFILIRTTGLFSTVPGKFLIVLDFLVTTRDFYRLIVVQRNTERVATLKQKLGEQVTTASPLKIG